jgi:hypothetical protein
MHKRAMRLALFAMITGVSTLFGTPIDVGYFTFRETRPLEGFNAFNVYERTGALGIVNSAISITALRIEVILEGGTVNVLFPSTGVVPSLNGVLLSNEVDAGSLVSTLALTRAELFYTVSGPATWSLDGGQTFSPVPGTTYSSVLYRGGADLVAGGEAYIPLHVGEIFTPEPATAGLVAAGIVCLLAYRKRQRI